MSEFNRYPTQDDELLDDDQTSAIDEALDRTPVIESTLLSSALKLVARYSKCVHCDARLHFQYQTDFGHNLAMESARCLECGLASHRTTHKLQ